MSKCGVKMPLVKRSQRKLSLRNFVSCGLSLARAGPVIGIVPTVRIR